MKGVSMCSAVAHQSALRQCFCRNTGAVRVGQQHDARPLLCMWLLLLLLLLLLCMVVTSWTPTSCLSHQVHAQRCGIRPIRAG